MRPPRSGRPPLPEGEALTERLRVRVSPEQLAAYRAAAARRGELLAEWVRRVLDREARRR